jgi:hypothetical protein
MVFLLVEDRTLTPEENQFAFVAKGGDGCRLGAVFRSQKGGFE